MGGILGNGGDGLVLLGDVRLWGVLAMFDVEGKRVGFAQKA